MCIGVGNGHEAVYGKIAPRPRPPLGASESKRFLGTRTHMANDGAVSTALSKLQASSFRIRSKRQWHATAVVMGACGSFALLWTDCCVYVTLTY